MKINSKLITLSTIINLFSVLTAFAQFPPVREYTNLNYHNDWTATVTFNGNPYMTCEPDKIMASYTIRSENTGLLIAEGNLSTKNCQPAVDDGTGWIFQDTLRQDKNELCRGRLELFDNVWLFDEAVQNKKCSLSDKSYYINTVSTSSENN